MKPVLAASLFRDFRFIFSRLKKDAQFRAVVT